MSLNSSKHYDLFISPTHYYQTYVVCCLSVIINSTLIYVILCEPHQTIGSYKYILLSFAAFDISYSIVDAIVKPALHSVDAAFMVITAGGPFAYPAPWGAVGPTLFCTFFSISFTILALHFVYRYISICHARFMFLFTRQYAIIWFIAVAILGLDYGLSVWFTMYPSKETIKENGSYEIYWRDSLGLVNLILIENITLDIILYCGYKVHKTLNKFNNLLSDQTRALQRQLFIALLVQTVIPLFFAYIPCWIVFVGPIFQVSFDWLSNNLLISAVMYFPVVDSLAILYFVKDFRRTLLQKVSKVFGCELSKKASNSNQHTFSKIHLNQNQVSPENG